MWQLSGIVGLPSPWVRGVTLSSLALQVEGHERSNWKPFAHLMSLLARVNGNKRVKASDFFPFQDDDDGEVSSPEEIDRFCREIERAQ